MTTDTDTKQDTIQRPARAWRNWFQSERDAVFENGDRHLAGVWVSPNRWPSEDVARSKAHEHMRIFAGWCADAGIEYLGAYPEGTRP